jgi:hypothetical protein
VGVGRRRRGMENGIGKKGEVDGRERLECDGGIRKDVRWKN